ncbi:MAG TPA: hypothetical protein VNW47_12535 [Terriglobales bacterium]|jgi:hypothetical protein|nr:hypothetical protein [Terriglobales bacterium]
MNNRRHFLGKRIGIASVVAMSIALVACEQSKQPAPPPASTTESVFAVFEGPWALVDDPKDANSVLALAPKLKTHNDLYMAASNDSKLDSGIYELTVPVHGSAFSGTLDASFAQVKIDAKSLQKALDDKSGRYVVRLPKPEAYVAARRYLSRVGPSYPPGPSSEQKYVTSVSLRYNVASLNGFSLSGTADTGTFNPLLLDLDTPTIRFAIEQTDAPPDLCHNHSRAAFRDAVKFLGVKSYVDFPKDSDDCHKNDPQNSGTVKAEMGPTPLESAAMLVFGGMSEAQTADSMGIPIRSTAPLASLFLFHATDGGCKAPILFLTATP